MLKDIGPAGRRDVDRVTPARGLDRLLADDDSSAGSEGREHEGREGLVQHDGAAVLVLDLDMVIGEVVALPLALRHPVVGIGDIVGGQFAEPARPHQARFQREIDMGRVGHHDALDIGRRHPDRLAVLVSEMDQRRHHAPVDVVGRMAAHIVDGVETLHLAVETHRQGDGQRSPPRLEYSPRAVGRMPSSG